MLLFVPVSELDSNDTPDNEDQMLTGTQESDAVTEFNCQSSSVCAVKEDKNIVKKIHHLKILLD